MLSLYFIPHPQNQSWPHREGGKEVQCAFVVGGIALLHGNCLAQNSESWSLGHRGNGSVPAQRSL